MEGRFTYDPENAQPPQSFGNFTHYVDASVDPRASLFSAGELLGSLTGGEGRVIVSDNGGGASQDQDVVNVSQCCGDGFAVGDWQANGASLVWVGDGFQDGTDLPSMLPPDNAPLPLALFSFSNTQSGAFAQILTIEVAVTEAVQRVEIDVKPGNENNCINPASRGVLPVAIFGSDVLDVAQVDQGSLNLDGLDVRVKGNQYPQCHGQYLRGDEYMDLVCHFSMDGSPWSGEESSAVLTGSLLDGTLIAGEDEVCLVPRRSGRTSARE
jgi:hypothetical protein